MDGRVKGVSSVEWVDVFSSYVHFCSYISLKVDNSTSSSTLSKLCQVLKLSLSPSTNHFIPQICVDATNWNTYVGGVLTVRSGARINHCAQVVGLSVNQQGEGWWRVRYLR